MAKQVFSSTSEVCHVWAQQTQPSGRAGNVFFRDSMIFSYGEHYLATQADNIVGQTIGHYTVRELTDTVVTIGCHAIELSEARAVLA